MAPASLALLAFLISCASTKLRQWPELKTDLPEKKHILSVPFYPQERYQCGPAALAMVLQWNGVLVSTEAHVSEVYTPSLRGSLQSALIGSARRNGQIAYEIYELDALIKEVSHGSPVIVLQNLGLSWYPMWHYAVVIGFDLEEGVILLHSGVDPNKKMSIKLFNNTWKRSDYWGLLVLRPSRMPATAEEEKFVEAIIGLEKTQKWQAAAIAYKTAIKKWTHSETALIGLGNTYYSMGQLDLAKTVFEEATCKFPNSGTAYNNLAQVLFYRGDKKDALLAAIKAVDIGGPMIDIYKGTLEEIQSDLK